MQAIILAAGMGKRLKSLTSNNTKCMIEVNGVSLIERTLSQLDVLGLSRIVLVVGYKGKKLMDYVSTLSITTPIIFVENMEYAHTNNIYSLWLARDYLLVDDTLLLESDIIFEDGILDNLVHDVRPTLALVDKYESWMDGTVVKIDDEDNIVAFVPGKQFRFDEIPEYYKTVNIYKFSKYFSETHYVPFLEAYVKALGENEYYEQVLRVLTNLGDSELKCLRLTGQSWYEIDDLQDLDIAESIFAENDETRVDSIIRRYGGFWRYPHITDFCYLVNPYYPPQRMIDEMKASFETLLRQYPSSQAINALLAAKLFGVNQEYVVVGNGAAELIQVLMTFIDGSIGIIRPTFEEYPNRIVENNIVTYFPTSDDFSYDVENLISFFSCTNIKTLVLINPDNPSGNYLMKSEVLRLVLWCENRGIRLVLDESFVDFADERDNTLLCDDILSQFTNLVVIKSISKSYGVPGVRLGVLASSDMSLVNNIRASLPIWNINSFGEFWLQIAEKYKSEYIEALDKLRDARASMIVSLHQITGIRVFNSQANYIMIELTNGVSSREVVRRLLTEDKLLVKDLTNKIDCDGRQFLRLAVRTQEENNVLVKSLASKLKEIF